MATLSFGGIESNGRRPALKGNSYLLPLFLGHLKPVSPPTQRLQMLQGLEFLLKIAEFVRTLFAIGFAKPLASFMYRPH